MNQHESVPEAVQAVVLDGAVLDHVAVAALRIRDLLPIYHDLLGGRFLTGGDNGAVGYRAVHLGYDGGGKVELLEPLRGSTFLDRFCAERGGGLHHLTFRVQDLYASVTAIEARGFAHFGLTWHNGEQGEVFIHPRDASGVLVQLVQLGDKYYELTAESSELAQVLAGTGAYGNGEPSP